MSLFSRPKVILWPKPHTTEIFLGHKKESNNFSFDINLFKKAEDIDLQTIATFFQQNQISHLSVLLPDDVVVSRSFIYDGKIEHIDKKEIASLAESFISFKINPDLIEYQLVPLEDKTVIRSYIYDEVKITHLKTNLARLKVNITSWKTVSASITSIIQSFYQEPYFLIYPTTQTEYLLLLSKNGQVYLSSTLKGKSLDIQKLINYSGLYFSQPVNKLFHPESFEAEIVTTAKLDKTTFSDNQVALKLKQPSNFPLPVLGLLFDSAPPSPGIMKLDMDSSITSPLPETKPKKNILPLVAVFIFTAALASIIIWFVLNRNADESLPGQTEPTPTVSQATAPTDTPAPTAAEINKKIKVQVLNATSINGQAATLKEKLVKLGFESVTVGNTSEKLTANEIRLKPSMKDYEAYFTSSLESEFPSTYKTSLSDSGTYDIVFLIGTDLRQTATPQATTPSPVVSP